MLTFAEKAQVGLRPEVMQRLDLILRAFYDHPELGHHSSIWEVTSWYDVVPALRGDLWVKLNNAWGRDLAVLSDHDFEVILQDTSLLSHITRCLVSPHVQILRDHLEEIWRESEASIQYHFEDLQAEPPEAPVLGEMPKVSDSDLIDWLADKIGAPKYAQMCEMDAAKITGGLPKGAFYHPCRRGVTGTQDDERGFYKGMHQENLLTKYYKTYVWKVAEDDHSDRTLETAKRAAERAIAMDVSKDFLPATTDAQLQAVHDHNWDPHCKKHGFTPPPIDLSVGGTYTRSASEQDPEDAHLIEIFSNWNQGQADVNRVIQDRKLKVQSA